MIYRLDVNDYDDSETFILEGVRGVNIKALEKEFAATFPPDILCPTEGRTIENDEEWEKIVWNRTRKRNRLLGHGHKFTALFIEWLIANHGFKVPQMMVHVMVNK